MSTYDQILHAGEKRGEKRGEQKTLRRAAMGMIKERCSNDLISKVLNVTEDYINSIRAELN